MSVKQGARHGSGPRRAPLSVSLRVRATDRDGDAIDQTVLRAFGLK
ncbi:hypothetical protein ACRAWF_43420 [Streptomyces sp. L7]